MSENLKHCPFCGGPAEIWQEVGHDGRYHAVTGCTNDDCRARTEPWPTRVLREFISSENAEHEPRAVASRAPCSCSAAGFDPECKWEGHHHAD